MKKYLSFIFCYLCCILLFVSCTKDTEKDGTSQPFAKAIEMIVHTVKDEPTDVSQSRGISSKYNDFDLVYDPDVIYLHIVGSDAAVKIPLYNKICSSEVCKCFSYYLEKFEDGSARITPLLEDGTPASTSLDIPAGSKLYFSSIEEAIWELPVTENREGYTFYQRNKDVNIEVYRSVENFSIDQLAGDIESLIMGRACAGFNVFTLFYDGDEYDKATDNDEEITLEPGEFETIMGSPLSTWYIKLYIGGSALTDVYDLGTMTSVDEDASGYYSTGNIGADYFVPFFYKKSSIDDYSVKCYGYYTSNGDQLLVPTTGEEMNIYVLIKHWEGDGEPGADWLASNENALYTEIDLDHYSHPINNKFYTFGLFMSIQWFKKAWDSYAQSSVSRTANGMYYFPSEDAKVICEQY